MKSARQWRERFESFVQRKTESAARATLPPLVTALDVKDGRMLHVGNAWSSRLFDGPFYLSPLNDRHRPSCSTVFVQSADGNTGASDPSTLGGGETDKHLIYEGLSRVAADGVLAGADTVRGADLLFSVWHPELVALRQALGLRRHPVQLVATRRGLQLDDILLFNVPDVPVIVITAETGLSVMRAAAADRPWIRMLVMDRALDLPRAFEQLRSMGVLRLSCVGGRHLAAELFHARLVDDLYLTTGPLPGGEPNTPLSAEPFTGRVIVRKHGTGPETGVRFEHVALATA